MTITNHCVAVIALSLWLFGRTTSSQESSCPFHLCTPERLGCPNSRLLRNARGCLECRCEENLVQDRPCLLHGCTVELLECKSSKLRKSADGCTLCECYDQVNSTVLSLPQNPVYSRGTSPVNSRLPISPELDSGTSNAPSASRPSQASVDCPPIACTPEQLGCDERLRINPLTGCQMCECGNDISGFFITGAEGSLDVNDPDAVIENPCPNPLEIVEGAGMRQGINKMEGSRKPKYKLAIGKLKKGFQPGRKYKISLKATSKQMPFKGFLFDITPAPAADSRTRESESAPTEPQAGDHSAESASQTDAASCGAGYLQDKDSGGVRVVPHCPTAAVEGDGSVNKTKSVVKWVAPSCGCVHIRVAVVDHTDTVGYLDRGTSSEATRPKRNVLSYTVCAKNDATARRKGERDRKRVSERRRVSWIVTDCCQAAISASSLQRKKDMRGIDACEQKAQLYSIRRYYRFSVMKKTCRKAYKKCCVMNKQLQLGIQESGRNRTRTSLPDHGRRLGGLIPMSRVTYQDRIPQNRLLGKKQRIGRRRGGKGRGRKNPRKSRLQRRGRRAKRKRVNGESVRSDSSEA